MLIACYCLQVILTTRDPAKWYESSKETVWEMSKVTGIFSAFALSCRPPQHSLDRTEQCMCVHVKYVRIQAMRGLLWHVNLVHSLLHPGYSIDMVDKLAWNGDLQGCFESDPAKAKRLFEQHNKEVQEVCFGSGCCTIRRRPSLMIMMSMTSSAAAPKAAEMCEDADAMPGQCGCRNTQRNCPTSVGSPVVPSSPLATTCCSSSPLIACWCLMCSRAGSPCVTSWASQCPMSPSHMQTSASTSNSWCRVWAR